MDIKLKDIKTITLEDAIRINKNLGFSFNVRDGKLKGIIVENKEVR